ncbi:MAG: signal peptidase II [Anaerolineales bacterium]|nr:signal peptidase II [Anaerolineales bacterium]MBS3752498.1 signal peptidase II [Anaerolineales bacterium]
MKKNLQAYLFLGSISGFIVALDQWTKTVVESNLVFNETWMPVEWLRPFLRIVHWKNTGAAFGIGQGLNYFFLILSIIVVLVIVYYFPLIPDSDRFFQTALSMQLGGAVGNLIDRISHGYVTDFISVGRFPVFNVADASITLGVGVLLLGIWFEERERRDE